MKYPNKKGEIMPKKAWAYHMRTVLGWSWREIYEALGWKYKK